MYIRNLADTTDISNSDHRCYGSDLNYEDMMILHNDMHVTILLGRKKNQPYLCFMKATDNLVYIYTGGYSSDGLMIQNNYTNTVFVPNSDSPRGDSNMYYTYGDVKVPSYFKANGTLMGFGRSYFYSSGANLMFDAEPPTFRMSLPSVLGLSANQVYQDANGYYFVTTTSVSYCYTDAPYWNPVLS
jgi:hypothetical protein